MTNVVNQIVLDDNTVETISELIDNFSNADKPIRIWFNPNDKELIDKYELVNRFSSAIPRSGCSRGYVWVF